MLVEKYVGPGLKEAPESARLLADELENHIEENQKPQKT